tara:strand:+ start:161 stop:682 length:522 start_codon:yes stop_codon:yes gene_type:complete
MGGNSGGNGGNGGGKQISGTPLVTSRRQVSKPRKSILDYSPTYQVIKAIGTAIKNIGTGNKTVKSGDTYAGEAYGYNEKSEKSNYVSRSPLANRGGDGSNIKQSNIKSEVQPKVASQMNAIKPITTPDGPTTIEMTNEDQKLTTKRKGRKSTILTSVTGLEGSPTLSKKSLLG